MKIRIKITPSYLYLFCICFMYFAPGATHAPHHVPKEWIDRYQGQFAHGWDRQRELIFARQKELGVIPADAGLTERHAEIPAWDDMSPGLKSTNMVGRNSFLSPRWFLPNCLLA